MSSSLTFPVGALTTSTLQQATHVAAEPQIADEADEELDDSILHPVYFDSADSLGRLSDNYALNPGILPAKGSSKFELLRQSIRANPALMAKTSPIGHRTTTWQSLPAAKLDFSMKLKKGSVQPVLTIHIIGNDEDEAAERFLVNSLALQHLTSPMVSIVLIVKSTIPASSGIEKDLSVTIGLSPADVGDFVQIASKLVQEAKVQQSLGKASWSWEHRGKAWPEHSVVRLFRSRPRFELTAPAESVQMALLAVQEEDTGAGLEMGAPGDETMIGLQAWVGGWKMCTMQ